MTLKFPLAAAYVAIFAAIVSLTACGGGGGGEGDSTPAAVAVASPAQLSTTDTVLGTGAEATTGKLVTVSYTLWLYSDTAADHKGAQIEAADYPFTVGSSSTIAGFSQGVMGMKVGGKRTVLVPASLAYGAGGSSSGKVPPNSGLVFDLILRAVQ
jgi:FKBP-type peptidyl-prolyl cis-trans isomerase FkpA